MKKYFIGLAVLLFVLCGWLWVRYEGHAHHPSDQVLVANFFEYRAGFERLAKMAGEDRQVLTIYPDPPTPSDLQVMFVDYRGWPRDCSQCFSTKRWAEYKAALLELGEMQPYRLSKESNIVLLPTSFEATDPDSDGEYIVSEKGYAYSVTELPDVVDSLNGLGFDDQETVFKRIEGNWYLYHERGVGKPE